MTKKHIAGNEILIEEAERYAQVNDVVNADALGAVWAELKARDCGYDAWFCYHDTDAPALLVDEIGAVPVDDCVEMRLSKRGYANLLCSGAEQIAETDLDAFYACYDERNPGMYWTSKRISSDLSRWGIFTILSEKQIQGYILIGVWDPVQAEIYCVEAGNSEHGETLIRAASGFAFDKGKAEVLYMADKNSVAHTAALAAGFVESGKYTGYRKTVPF